jgi:tRNA pseudouridine55 synthase
MQDDVHRLHLRVRCSKGTYIRTLGEDIGQALGCGAYLASLRRTQSGAFDQTDCVSLDAFEQAQERQREGYLLPVASLLKSYEPITLGQADAGRFLSGLRRRGDWADHPRVVVFGDQPHTLLGTAHVQSGELIPDRLLNPQEIQSMIESAA